MFLGKEDKTTQVSSLCCGGQGLIGSWGWFLSSPPGHLSSTRATGPAAAQVQALRLIVLAFRTSLALLGDRDALHLKQDPFISHRFSPPYHSAQHFCWPGPHQPLHSVKCTQPNPACSSAWAGVCQPPCAGPQTGGHHAALVHHQKGQSPKTLMTKHLFRKNVILRISRRALHSNRGENLKPSWGFLSC